MTVYTVQPNVSGQSDWNDLKPLLWLNSGCRATTWLSCVFWLFCSPLSKHNGWWTFCCPDICLEGHEERIELLNSETWSAALERDHSHTHTSACTHTQCHSRPLYWICTSSENTDWESHMAGNKPRAGCMSALCRGSGTLPLYPKWLIWFGSAFKGSM